MNGTLLGVDLGEKRIGLAIAEADGLSARPLMTVPRGADLEADATTLRPIATANGVAGLVVGLPLNANGDEGPMAVAARAWATEISRRLGLPASLRDERLSSHVAEGRLGPMPRGRSGGPPSKSQRDRYRARVDREAAAVILQDELDAQRAR
jgi:putative Holliday junction resolvase